MIAAKPRSASQSSTVDLTTKRALDLVDGFPWTDSGNADRLLAMYGQDLRYVRKWNKWLWWNAKCWAEDEGAAHRAAKAMARGLMKQAQRISDADRRSAAIRWALKCESKASIEAAVSLARHELSVTIEHDALDANPWLLCVRNGTIDLRSGELRPHARADLITKITPVE